MHSRDCEYVRDRDDRGGYISLFVGMFPFAPSTIMLIIYDVRAASANKTDCRMLVNLSLSSDKVSKLVTLGDYSSYAVDARVK